MAVRYRDRRDAGRRLAAKLSRYARRTDVQVLALPRGGVPVAFEVAQALGAPLDVFVVRKLGLPGHEEFAMGAIASGGVVVLNDEVVRSGAVRRADIDRVIESERQELVRREHRYRGDRPLADIAGKTVILVDDGLATGSSMWAAVSALRQEGPARTVVAVPISSPAACDALHGEVDEIVCAMTPEPFYAVGLWYEDFSQTTDEEVHELLERARNTFGDRAPGAPPHREVAPAAGEGAHRSDAGHIESLRANDDASPADRPAAPSATEGRIVHVPAGTVTLEGALTVPAGATGIVLFAHGSGSSRQSPRNRYVAEVLREGGLATLLIDLLTSEEEAIDLRGRALRFDIELLAERVVGVIDWLAEQPTTRALPVGLFGASTGGGAALVAAARRPDRVRAVVSRGGRPDLAGDALRMVEAPTLLLVGGRDAPVIALNERAMARMLAAAPRPQVRLEIIPGATHLFEEPGTLEAVARAAREWFAHRLTTAHVEPVWSR